MNLIEAPPVASDPWSDMYGTAKALLGHAVAASKETLLALKVGDREAARQAAVDAERLFRLADRILITATMQDDEAVVVSDPAVYAVHHATTHPVDNPLADLIQTVTQKLEEEAHFGSDR